MPQVGTLRPRTPTALPMAPVMIDFEYMKNIVELVKRVDDQNRPGPMDLGSFSETHDHAEYVSWNDQGAPEWPEDQGEWSADCAQGHDPWPEETHRLAAIAEADASHQNALDAINGIGGKGGKGGKAKGKGKGKGKLGKEKGKDMPGQTYRPPTQTQAQTGAETRQCYNCGEYGHLGKDCRHPDRRKAAGAAARSLEDTSSQAGSARSLSIAMSALAQGGMRRLCTMRVADDEGGTTSTENSER